MGEYGMPEFIGGPWDGEYSIGCGHPVIEVALYQPLRVVESEEELARPLEPRIGIYRRRRWPGGTAVYEWQGEQT